MQTSIFLAKLIGPICLALGGGLLVNGEVFRSLARDYLDRPELVFLLGLISMPAGLAIVLTHNVWAADWRIIITIMGWIALIAGAIRLMAPQRAAAIGGRSLDNPNATWIGGAVYVAIGAALCFFGYFNNQPA